MLVVKLALKRATALVSEVQINEDRTKVAMDFHQIGSSAFYKDILMKGIQECVIILRFNLIITHLRAGKAPDVGRFRFCGANPTFR